MRHNRSQRRCSVYSRYPCYQIKPTKDVTAQTPDKGDGTGRFRRDLQFFLDDPFFANCAHPADGVTPSLDGMTVEGACLFKVIKPAELWNPIDKSELQAPRVSAARGVIDGSSASTLGSLLCYKARLATRFPYGPAAPLAGTATGTRLDPKQAKHVKRRQKTGNPVLTTADNQFPGPVVVEMSKQTLGCIPTDVVGFSVAP